MDIIYGGMQQKIDKYVKKGYTDSQFTQQHCAKDNYILLISNENLGDHK